MKLTVSKAQRARFFDQIVAETLEDSIDATELIRNICLYKNPNRVINSIRNQFKPYIRMLETGEISDQDAIDVGHIFTLDMFDQQTTTPKFVAWTLLTSLDTKYSKCEVSEDVEFRVQVVKNMIELNKAEGACRMGYVHPNFLMRKLIPLVMGNFKDSRVDDLVETYKLLYM